MPRIWAVLLAVVILGPALLPGYVLSFDMVWVPHLAFTRDVWGLGAGLPRAVPSDGVVAILGVVIPQMLLQKIVLVGAIAGGGWGMARLIPHAGPATVAVSVYEWNALVAERLLIGHWPLLVAYGVLPWLIGEARRLRTGAPIGPVLVVLVLLGSLNASVGLMTAAVVLALAADRSRRTIWLVLLLAAANAPWLVTGLLHASDARSSAIGADVFKLAAEGAVPAPLAALSLGGIWNTVTVPGSRTTAFGWGALGLTAVFLTLGARTWWHNTSDRRERTGLVALAGAGYVLALATWAAPGFVGTVASTLPGAGVLRDGARLLMLAAPLLAFAAAGVVQWVAARWAHPDLRFLGTACLALAPLAALPDLAFGNLGDLRATHYPASVLRLAAATDRATTADSSVLVLPLAPYRAPTWNRNRRVLDPFPRLLMRPTVVGDDLYVNGRRVPGESRVAREIGTLLASTTGPALCRGLAAQGIDTVVVERGGLVAQITGDRFDPRCLKRLATTPAGVLYRVPGPSESVGPATFARLLAAGAWLSWPLALATTLLVGRKRRTARRPTSGGGTSKMT